MKRALAMLLALILCVGCAPAGMRAVEPSQLIGRPFSATAKAWLFPTLRWKEAGLNSLSLLLPIPEHSAFETHRMDQEKIS